MQRHVLAGVLLATAAAACAGTPSSSSGDDAGPLLDASPRSDAAGQQPADAAIPDATNNLDAATVDAATVDASSLPDAAAVDASTSQQPDAAMGAPDGGTACPTGLECVDTFPFHFEGTTLGAASNTFNNYGCASTTNEGGPEILFMVTVPQAGFLSVAVHDDAVVDIDVHILSSQDAAACLSRGDHHAKADVPAGTYFVVADSYVSGGVPKSGAFQLDIGFLAPSHGPCAMETGEMARVNDLGNHLAMPATGPMVKEAHLVTQEEPAPYPSTATDELEAHYALSQARTGLVMFRQEVWAPLEGGSHYGAGIGSPTTFPVLDEGWYVNMYWTSAARPARGTRMIVRDPQGGARAVVVAAGYETGPGNLAHIGGTPEETHFYMGTGHLDDMTLGISVDQGLPLGPRVCE